MCEYEFTMRRTGITTHLANSSAGFWSGSISTYTPFMNYRQEGQLLGIMKRKRTYSEVEPQIQPIRRVQIRTPREPLRAERHPSAFSLVNTMRSRRDITRTRHRSPPCKARRASSATQGRVGRSATRRSSTAGRRRARSGPQARRRSGPRRPNGSPRARTLSLWAARAHERVRVWKKERRGVPRSARKPLLVIACRPNSEQYRNAPSKEKWMRASNTWRRRFSALCKGFGLTQLTSQIKVRRSSLGALAGSNLFAPMYPAPTSTSR
jgi:hypothetical protein